MRYGLSVCLVRRFRRFTSSSSHFFYCVPCLVFDPPRQAVKDRLLEVKAKEKKTFGGFLNKVHTHRQTHAYTDRQTDIQTNRHAGPSRRSIHSLPNPFTNIQTAVPSIHPLNIYM